MQYRFNMVVFCVGCVNCVLLSTSRWSIDDRNMDRKVNFFSPNPLGQVTDWYIGWFDLRALARYHAQIRPRLSETESTLASACRWSMAAVL